MIKNRQQNFLLNQQISFCSVQHDTYSGPALPVFFVLVFLSSRTNLSLSDFHLLLQSVTGTPAFKSLYNTETIL